MTKGRRVRLESLLPSLALLLVVGTAASAAATGGGVASTAEKPATAEQRYVGPDGEPLPFTSDDEVLEFLRTAKIVDRTRTGIGVNNPERLVLEKDGIRARAVFRVVDIEVRRKRVGDRFFFLFRDNHLHECAAYLVSRLFELGHVPPVVPREIGSSAGSVQLWIEDTFDETAEGFSPPEALPWVRQLWEMHLFDNLVGNVDRNPGNLLVDSHYRLCLIDHTRAFQVQQELIAPDRISGISRRSWHLLQTVTDDRIREAMLKYLGRENRGSGDRLRAFQHRRQLVIDLLRERLDERGEGSVLYWRPVPEVVAASANLVSFFTQSRAPRLRRPGLRGGSPGGAYNADKPSAIVIPVREGDATDAVEEERRRP